MQLHRCIDHPRMQCTWLRRRLKNFQTHTLTHTHSSTTLFHKHCGDPGMVYPGTTLILFTARLSKTMECNNSLTPISFDFFFSTGINHGLGFSRYLEATSSDQSRIQSRVSRAAIGRARICCLCSTGRCGQGDFWEWRRSSWCFPCAVRKIRHRVHSRGSRTLNNQFSKKKKARACNMINHVD